MCLVLNIYVGICMYCFGSAFHRDQLYGTEKNSDLFATNSTKIVPTNMKTVTIFIISYFTQKHLFS